MSFVLFSTVTLLVHFVSSVSATSSCSAICPHFIGTMAAKRCSQQYLFTGKVLRQVVPSTNSETTREFEVRVLNSYRDLGVHAILPGTMLTMSTPMHYSRCGVTPNIGGDYLFGTDDVELHMDNSAGQGEPRSSNESIGTFNIRLVCDTFEVVTPHVELFLNNGACQ